MLLNPLSTAEIQCFINENIDKSISKLALQKNPFPEVEWISILNQIEAKTKAKERYDDRRRYLEEISDH